MTIASNPDARGGGAGRPIYYAAAAGNILQTYLHWRDGIQDPSKTAATYSGLFYDLCDALGRPGAASFPATEEKELADGHFSIRSRPPTLSGSGWRYHVAQFRAARWLMKDIRRSGASDVIVMDGATYWFLLAPAAWRGIRIWLSVHTVLWSPIRPLRLGRKLVLRCESWFLRNHCSGSIVVSARIRKQMEKLGGRKAPLPQVFRPLYDEKDFSAFDTPSHRRKPFRVLYSGRIEADKGVFDLLSIAKDLRSSHGEAIVFELLGDGGAMPELAKAVAEADLQDTFELRGHCTRPELLVRLAEAHVVIAPTRSTFPEGLNKAIIEAILAYRPVVTSSVCPALDLVGDAAVEATPDDPGSYRDALIKLFEDRDFYESKAAATKTLRGLFFDREESWFGVAKRMIE
jgi:glycosyltransferase involved in cell wall biosynthesis